MRTSSLLSLVIVTAAASLGCQSDATGPLIVEADPIGLTVVPGTGTVDGGRALRLTASLRLPNGSTATAPDVTWSSSDGTIATVGQDGIVQGVRSGQVQIVATWHDSRGSSLVTVVGPASKGKQPPRCLDQTKASAPADGTCV